MATVAKLGKYGRFKLLGGNLNTRMPPVQSGLVVHFPFDGTLKPTPLAEFNYDNTPGIASTHPVHPDLFLLSAPQTVTVPGLGSAKYVVAEFDVYFADTAGTSMVCGFLRTGVTTDSLDIFINGAKIGLNAWDSTTYGANLPVGQRTRVTFFIDPAAPINSKLYFNGVAQTMVGTAPAAKDLGDQVVLGNGRPDTPQYLNLEPWGNFKIYTLDVDSVLGYGTDLDAQGRGVFIGQSSNNLLYTAGVPDFSVVAIESTSLSITTVEEGLRWRWARTGTVGTGNIRLNVPLTKFVDGETYTLSYKWKVVSGNASPALVTDLSDVNPTRKITLDFGDYKQTFVTGTRADYTDVMRFWDINLPADTTVEVWELCMEQKHTGSVFSTGARGASGAYLKFNAYLPTDHTLISRSRHTLDNAEKVVAITKSGNTFKVYENGEDVTASRQNKWRMWRYYRPTVNYTMSQAADNIQAIINWDAADFTNQYWNQSADKAATYWRTFVYADADVRIWWRFAADNGGQIRTNGRDTQSLGNWDANVNPDVYVDLKVGWNVVEIWGMDGDSGGTVSLGTQHTSGLNENLTTSTNKVAIVKLSAHPNVKFMTSEAPLDYLNGTDGGGFTHGFQKFLYELSLYSRALSVGEVGKFTDSMFTLTSDGDLYDDLDETEENLWPDPDMTSVTYSISNNNNPPVTIQYDDGKYHQLVINQNIWTYKGYSITGEAGATYLFSAEVWRSTGSNLGGPGVLAVEGATSGNTSIALSTIPVETWTYVEKTFVSDGAVSCFPVYPTGSTATGATGTVKWRNVCVRKLPSKAMSASPTVVKVGEIVEA